MQVEKAVKGEQADMSIYNRTPARVDKKKIAEPQTPPPLAKTVPLNYLNSTSMIRVSSL